MIRTPEMASHGPDGGSLTFFYKKNVAIDYFLLAFYYFCNQFENFLKQTQL